MIGRGEITKAAQRDRVDAQTVERDYILAHAATDIATVGGERLVLKGGTSLRLAHFENYRYSADLDYSLVDITTTDGLATISEALESCRLRLAMPMLTLDADPRRRLRAATDHVRRTAERETALDQDRPCRRRTRYRIGPPAANRKLARPSRERVDPRLLPHGDLRGEAPVHHPTTPVPRPLRPLESPRSPF